MNRGASVFKELDSLLENYGDGKFQNWGRNILKKNTKRFLNDIKCISKYHTQGEILEIGSAPYHLTYALARLGYSVTGIDIDPSRFEKFINDQGFNIIKRDIEREGLPFENDSFHFIIFNEIFEHLRIDPISTLREIHRVLHPEGFLLLTTPNLYAIQNIVSFLRGQGFDNPYDEFEKIHSLGHMGHVRLYSGKQLKEFLHKTGFNVVYTDIKSYKPLRGWGTPFNLVRGIFPAFHTIQITISKKL